MGHERLADKLHCSVSMINRALGVLIDAGYIEVDPDRNGARRVIIGYGLTGVRHDRHRN